MMEDTLKYYISLPHLKNGDYNYLTFQFIAELVCILEEDNVIFTRYQNFKIMMTQFFQNLERKLNIYDEIQKNNQDLKIPDIDLKHILGILLILIKEKDHDQKNLVDSLLKDFLSNCTIDIDFNSYFARYYEKANLMMIILQAKMYKSFEFILSNYAIKMDQPIDDNQTLKSLLEKELESFNKNQKETEEYQIIQKLNKIYCQTSLDIYRNYKTMEKIAKFLEKNSCNKQNNSQELILAFQTLLEEDESS